MWKLFEHFFQRAFVDDTRSGWTEGTVKHNYLDEGSTKVVLYLFPTFSPCE